MNRPSVYSLARANGRGSAGKCPAVDRAKTPAVEEPMRHVVASAYASQGCHYRAGRAGPPIGGTRRMDAGEGVGR